MSLAERIGQNLPSQELVRALDAALTAEGALLALRDQAKAEQRARRPSLSQPASRVRVHNETAVGTGADLGPETEADAFDRLAAVLARPRGADRAVVEHLAAVLARQRALEDDLGPRAVLPAVLAEVDLLDTLARQALGATRSRLIKLTGEYRQFLTASSSCGHSMPTNTVSSSGGGPMCSVASSTIPAVRCATLMVW